MLKWLKFGFGSHDTEVTAKRKQRFRTEHNEDGHMFDTGFQWNSPRHTYCIALYSNPRWTMLRLEDESVYDMTQLEANEV
jgi:hypothetical protein